MMEKNEQYAGLRRENYDLMGAKKKEIKDVKIVELGDDVKKHLRQSKFMCIL